LEDVQGKIIISLLFDSAELMETTQAGFDYCVALLLPFFTQLLLAGIFCASYNGGSRTLLVEKTK